MYKEIFDDCIEVLDNLTEEFNEAGNVLLYQRFDTLLSTYYVGLQDSSRIDYHQENLIVPALSLMQTMNQTNPQVRYLTNKLVRCSQIYNHIKLQNLQVGQDLVNHFKYLNKIKEVLEKELEFIESKK